jgi:hypothetical protein
MKYAIVSTWNGEGYSYQNTAELKEFKNDSEAQIYLRQLLNEQDATSDATETDGCITYEIGDDQGSFVFIRNAELIFGIMILANVNEVHPLLSKKDWLKHLKRAVQQSDPDDLDELDLSDESIFICAYDSDYDYQFVKLNYGLVKVD